MIRTKEIIREAFWELLEEKPYNKITVQDIVNRCQVNRNTFYYHFQDIPALMEESVKEWMEDVIHRYGNLESPVYCLMYIAGECMKRKNAFLHLFRSTQKDVFLSNLNKMAYGVVGAYVNEVEEYRDSSPAEKERVIRCCKCVFVGVLLDWLEEDASFDLPEFCEEICSTLAESASHMIAGYRNE